MKTLRIALDRYLALRRSLGFKLREYENALLSFIAFLDSKGAEFVTTELALEWAQEPRQATRTRHARCLSMVRGFARYLQANDPRTQVPPQGLLPGRSQRPQPYIYSNEEILDLIREASRLQPSGALRPHMYSTAFGLLAVTGMRVSEIAALDRADVDLKQGVLTVRKSKFNRTRLVPVHSSTQRELQAYARLRDRLIPVRPPGNLACSAPCPLRVHERRPALECPRCNEEIAEKWHRPLRGRVPLLHRRRVPCSLYDPPDLIGPVSSIRDCSTPVSHV